MQRVELIALLAVLVSGLTALYVRQSRREAQKANTSANRANEIAVHNEMRELRLLAYNLTSDFLHFCVTYETQRQLHVVTRARDLVQRLDGFREQITQLGPLNMLAVEQQRGEIIAHAWALQRVIDRLEGIHDRPENPDYELLMQELHDLLDWFAVQETEIPILFQEFLTPYV